MLPSSNAIPTEFFPEALGNLKSDATDLYYPASGGLMRTPIASAAPSAVGVSGLSVYDFALYADGIFALESSNGGGLLSRAPKSGGAFQRVRALGAGVPGNLKVVGDRYFLDVLLAEGLNSKGKTQVLTAGFAGTDPPLRLLERNQRHTPTDQLWVATADALFWSEGQAIYKQPLPTP
jgi:hypothetical protein